MSDVISLLQNTNGVIIRILSIIAFIAVMLFLYILENRLRSRNIEHSERLFSLSRRLHCSEYDIFHKAAEKWNIPDDRVRTDFKGYLFYDEIPFYVRDFIRTYPNQSSFLKMHI